MAHLQLGHVDRFTALARALFTVEPAPGAIDRFAVGSALVMAYLLTGGLYEFARAFMARTRAVLGPRLAGSPVARGWIGWAECCVTKYETGDSWRHLQLADEGIAAFAEAGDVRGSIRIRMERAIALRQLGLFAEAEAQIEETLALSERMGVRFLEAGSRAQLGLLRTALGRVAAAREAADQAIALYHEMGNTLAEAAAGLMRAMVKLAAGDPGGALEDAAAGAATIAAPPGRAMALAVLAEARLARGELAEALAASEEAEMLLTRMGSIPEGETNVRLVRAEALRAAGRAEEAGRVIAKAQERLRARAAAIPDEAVRHGFLRRVDVNRRTMEF
jgi:tetratricopeptide (TPR) repeat protein